MTSIVNNNFVQAYLDLNKSLVRSMVIKSNFAIRSMNEEVVKELGEFSVNPDDPSYWRYYMNVAGEYHSLDTPMYVNSLDTKEEILFSKEALKTHTATAEGYRQGTRLYYALTQKYPNQKFLINCILNPGNKEEAISSEQGSILTYDRSLVEENENTLISELETFIKLYLERNYVEAFTFTDPYYGYLQWICLSQQTLLKLLNLRLKRCKTPEVHSFHLTQYLASHHRLDRFLPYLTREQALWFYRNICYIERNAGKTETFHKLIEMVLDKRNIPLNDLTIQMLSEFDSEGYGIPVAIRKPISKTVTTSQNSLISFEELCTMEHKTAYGNEAYLDQNQNHIKRSFANQPSSVVTIKDLESHITDLTNSVPDPLPDVVMRQWLSMTHMGLYNVSVNFQDPKTTIEYSLSSWDAIVYTIYITCKMYGYNVTKIPTATTVKYRRHPRTPVAELKAVIERGMEWMDPVADDLVAAQPILTECTSVTQFFQMTYKVYEECLHHWYLLADTQDVYARGVMEQMILKLFESSLLDFSRGEDIETWRERLSIPAYDYTYEEAQLLLTEIFGKATGLVLDNDASLRNIQAALLKLFETLSSYSIQTIKEINDETVILTGGSSIRTGNIQTLVKDLARVYIEQEVLSAENLVKDQTNAVDSFEVTTSSAMVSNDQWADIIIDNTIEFWAQSRERVYVNIPRPAYGVRHFVPDPVTGTLVEVADKPLHKTLTQEELKKLANLEIYQ